MTRPPFLAQNRISSMRVQSVLTLTPDQPAALVGAGRTCDRKEKQPGDSPEDDLKDRRTVEGSVSGYGYGLTSRGQMT